MKTRPERNRHYKNDPRKRLNDQLRHKYGITADQFDTMVEG